MRVDACKGGDWKPYGACSPVERCVYIRDEGEKEDGIAHGQASVRHTHRAQQQPAGDPAWQRKDLSPSRAQPVFSSRGPAHPRKTMAAWMVLRALSDRTMRRSAFW